MRSKLTDRISRLEHLEQTASQPNAAVWHATPEEKGAIILAALERAGMADAFRDLDYEAFNLAMRHLAENAKRQKMSGAWDSPCGLEQARPLPNLPCSCPHNPIR